MLAEDPNPNPPTTPPAPTPRRNETDPARLAAEVRDLAVKVHGLLDQDSDPATAWFAEATEVARRIERLKGGLSDQPHAPLGRWVEGVKARLDARRHELCRARVSV